MLRINVTGIHRDVYMTLKCFGHLGWYKKLRNSERRSLFNLIGHLGLNTVDYDDHTLGSVRANTGGYQAIGRTKFWISFARVVRMAERSKAPDSRVNLLCKSQQSECSGPRMWAWVRIPLLTNLFQSMRTTLNSAQIFIFMGVWFWFSGIYVTGFVACSGWILS